MMCPFSTFSRHEILILSVNYFDKEDKEEESYRVLDPYIFNPDQRTLRNASFEKDPSEVIFFSFTEQVY